MTELLLILLKVSFAVVIVSVGMGSAFSDVTYLLRRPGLLLRSLVAMYVLVPLAAFVLVHVLPMGATAKMGLLVLAVSAGAPLLPKKLGSLESQQYIFSLVVLSSLLAIVWVPAWVQWLGHYFNTEISLSARAVAKAITMGFLLPLAIGMVLRLILPRLAARFSDSLMTLAGLVLALSGLLLLLTHWQLLGKVGWQGFLALAAFMVAALCIGHWMGGPSRDERTSLAIACSTRHLGIALMLGSAVPGPSTPVMLAGYVVVLLLVSVPYLRWRSRRAGTGS